MKRFAQLLLFFAALPAFAQFTTVTATVHDPVVTTIPYAYGSVVPILVYSGGTPTLNGQAYSPPSQPVGLDASGTFILNLAANASLSPGGSQWNFRVCSNNGTVQPAVGKLGVCFTLAAPITISGSSQNISTQLNAAALPLTNLSASGGITLETNGTPNGSQTLLNITCTTGITCSDNGSGTIMISGSGAGGVSGSGTTNTIPKWTAATALGNSSLTDNGSVIESITEPIQSTVSGAFGPGGSPGLNSSSLSVGDFPSTNCGGSQCDLVNLTYSYNATGNISAPLYGVYNTDAFGPGGITQTITTSVGANFSSIFQASSGTTSTGLKVVEAISPSVTASLTNAIGLSVLSGEGIANATTITNNKVIDAQSTSTVSSTTSNDYTVYVESPAAAGNTITNHSGIFIADQDLGTVNGSGSNAWYGLRIASQTPGGVAPTYGIFTASSGVGNTPNYFQGPLQEDQYVDIKAIAAPSNPASGYQRFYASSSTGFLACLNSSGGSCLTTPAVQSSIIAILGSDAAISANTPTSFLSQAVTMPATGCPCRVLASYGTYLSATNAGIDVVWIDDGASHQFATSQVLVTGTASLYGTSASSMSPTTYSNGAVVTFSNRVEGSNSGGFTVSAVNNQPGPQNTWMNLAVMTSN